MKFDFAFLAPVALSLVAASSHGTQSYRPNGLNAKTAKVIVVIHGCLQSAESMAFGTGFNQLADQNNLLVIYPQVPANTNPIGCWNWYLPENQRPESGQLKNVVTEIHETIKASGLRNPDVFVTGISSGGATVAGLLACYPNEFRAGAIHSGPSYGLASNLTEGERVLREGPDNTATSGPCHPKDFRGSLLVIQGSADKIVHPSHARRIAKDFSNAVTRIEMVDGLGHAWSGASANLRHKEALEGLGSAGATKIPFFAESGPNATQMIWDFFKTASAKAKRAKK